MILHRDRAQSHKNALRPLLFGFGAVLVMGCASEKKVEKAPTLDEQTQSLAAMVAQAAMGSGLGFDGGSTELPPAELRKGQGASLETLDALAAEWQAVERIKSGDARSLDGNATDSGEPETYWAIALGTFAREDHANAAKTMLMNLPKVAPQLEGATVHTSEKGSMVIYGRYDAIDDPAAKEGLKQIKSIRSGRRMIFPRAMLAKITTEGTRRHPHALMTARAKYPNVDPLYTVQVAMWGNFDSGQYSAGEIRKMSRDHAARLRAQGHEAYFYYDDALELGTVTVGLFGQDAIDPSTGLKSSAVMQVIREFPIQLVNGAPLKVPVDRFGSRAEDVRSGLVNVPK